jgi:hypothetical protein
VRPSLRFLALIVVGWAGLRAATLGALPGGELFRIEPSEAKVPPLLANQFPSLGGDLPDQALAPGSYGGAPDPEQPTGVQAGLVPVAIRYIGTLGQVAPTAGSVALPSPRAQFYAGSPAFPDYPYARLAALSSAPLQSTMMTPGQSTPADALKRDRLDRLQLTAWALLRPPAAGLAGSRSLAAGGSLGASQAGARLTYNFTRQLAATFRSSSEVGRRGGEVAAGVRAQPVKGIPLWINAERRQRIGRFGGGRSAFAAFVEAGLYDRPMPMHFLLDGYVQAGVVGARSRDWFVDGAATVTRPVYKQFSAGLGIWGGAQPGLYRLDAGPRVTMRVRQNLKVHADWRQHLAGNAIPGSGPAVTLAGDF